MQTYLQLLKHFQDPTAKVMDVVHASQVHIVSILRARTCKIHEDPEEFGGISLTLRFRENQS
jgi:hypothetical protein